MKYREKYLQAILTEYQPDTETTLSLKDAEEITDNLTNLFKYLAYLDRKYRNKIKKSA